MTTFRAAATAAMGVATAALLAGAVMAPMPAFADWNAPWKNDDRALVIDAYEFNPINWQELTSDKRVAGFINKASDGLPPEWNCSGTSGDDYKLCKNRWWKYSVTKELYMTRREMAKMKGLEWGAYHLGRPGNPRAQADHFVDFAEPEKDDLLALDIEDRSDEWMSLSDAEIFADQIKIRTGRYPVLYTNGSTAKYISDNAEDYPLLSRLPLWYARYREDITGRFPEETWPTYALWQFSSMHNCDSRSCPYRVKGTKTDIDVNVSTMDVAGLKKAWPFDRLIEEKADPDASMLIAALDDKTKADVAAVSPDAAVPGTMAAAYGPSQNAGKVDPLKLLTAVARREHEAGRQKAGMPHVEAAHISPENAEKLSVHLKSLGSAIRMAAAKFEKLLVSPAEAATTVEGERLDAGTPDELSSLRGKEHSRFLDIMEAAAAAKKAGSLPMPARVLSQLGPEGSGRGDRVADTDRYGKLDENARRIASAFETTR